jgi:hypothetical protein
MDIVAEVKLELTELAKLGIHKSRLTQNLDYVDSHPVEICQYYANGVTISEIADLVTDLAALK